MRKTYIILLLLLFIPTLAGAQHRQWSLGVNSLDMANMGTLNLEASVAASRHITANASVRINPWTFGKGDGQKQKQHREQTYAAGVRYWPWNIYSGWWIGGKAQFMEYNWGGFLRKQTEEGNAYGLGVSAGYTWMLHEHVNLEVGAGLWGGYKTYTVYTCPKCGKIIDKGSKAFVMPNEAILSIVYVF